MNKKSNVWKMWLGVLLVSSGAVFAFVRIWDQVPKPVEPRNDFRPSAQERERMREEVMSKADLTEDQRLALDELGPPPEDFTQMREFREKVEQIMTPEQTEVFRETMRSTMRARMNERLQILPEGEREKFEAKLEERMANGRGPFGPGGFGGRRGDGNAE